MNDKVRVLLSFVDGSTFATELNEDVLVEQLSRPPNKRLYVCGIQFSEVTSAEVTG
jgi:hypothetical protein